MSPRRFLTCTISIIVIALGALAAVTFYLDPLFHYSAPRNGWYYDLLDKYERLQNDGILRHFDYDAMIVGSSMCQNFKPSEADELFGTKTVKTCFSGGTWKETSDVIKRALSYNPDIKYVFRGLDYGMLMNDKDKLGYDPSSYPTYLTNSNPFDDIEYLLNKTVIFDYVIPMVESRRAGQQEGVRSLDEYENFDDYAAKFGLEALTELYGDLSYKGKGTEQQLSDDEAERLRASIKQNITDIAESYPNTQFYCFIPPFSILGWMNYSEQGEIDKMIDAEQILIEALLKYDNIKLYSFNDMPQIISDLDNYMDKGHYSEDINSLIMKNMRDDTGLITSENYKDYLAKEKSFFNGYDYDSIAVK